MNILYAIKIPLQMREGDKFHYQAFFQCRTCKNTQLLYDGGFVVKRWSKEKKCETEHEKMMEVLK